MKGETLKKVKISVIKLTFDEELAKQYGAEGIEECELHDVGQVYYSNGWQKPSGLCDNAWSCMKDYVLAISQGAGFIYGDGNFTNKEGMAIVACNDGIRPAIFKVEATDMPSEIFNEDISTIKSLHKDPNNTSTK